MNWSGYAGSRIYLDANSIIYAFEHGFGYVRSAQAFFAALDRKEHAAITSEITIAEVFTAPLRQSNLAVLSFYERFFSLEGQIELIAVDRPLIFAAARVSASSRLKLVDAIHVATAQASNCDHFLTHDERLGRTLPDSLKWLRFSDVN